VKKINSIIRKIVSIKNSLMKNNRNNNFNIKNKLKESINEVEKCFQ